MTTSTTSCSPLRIHRMKSFPIPAIKPTSSWATRINAPQKPLPTLTECAQEVIYTAHTNPKLPFTSSWDLSSRNPSSGVIQHRSRCGGNSHCCETCFAQVLKSLLRNSPFSILTWLVLIPQGRFGSAPYGLLFYFRSPHWCLSYRFAVTVRSRCTRISYLSILWNQSWRLSVADPLLDPCRVRKARRESQRPETTWCCEKAEFKASISPTNMVRYIGIYSWHIYMHRLWSPQIKMMYVFLHLKSQLLSLRLFNVLITELYPRLNIWRDLSHILWTERCVRQYWDLTLIFHYSSKSSTRISYSRGWVGR